MWRKLLIILVGLLLIFLFGKRTGKRIKPINNPLLLNSRFAAMASLIEAMAKHESGNYSNRLSREYYNIFSMGFPRIRPALNIGSSKAFDSQGKEPSNWSVYSSYDMAIKDLILWFEYTKFPTNLTTPFQFARELKSRGYYTDSFDNYLEGLKRNL